MTRYLHHSLALILCVCFSGPGSADAKIWTLTVETGPAWFSRNDVRIPNDSTGDRFDLLKLTGQGAEPYIRAHLAYQLSDEYSFSLLYAPLRTNGRGVLDDDIRFAGDAYSGPFRSLIPV